MMLARSLGLVCLFSARELKDQDLKKKIGQMDTQRTRRRGAPMLKSCLFGLITSDMIIGFCPSEPILVALA